MIDRLEKALRYLRRSSSRSRLMTRVLGLTEDQGDPARPGLLMIQVDGLSREEFSRALEQGEMPFLQRLLQCEGYQVHTQYSGLPASTPAVQAELFYGIKSAVPAFSFRDHASGEVVRMYEPDAASRLEKHLSAHGGEPLLLGGSAYSDNFTGGAAEAHFCPSALGWGPPLRYGNPLRLVLLLLLNAYSFLRVAVLLLLELLLGAVDFSRGVTQGRNILKELKFIPTRVAICILLRELCVIGGKIDLHRGLPIVHINFLGYDEQSHRRGPSSLFAHWTLKGIDDAIARLWRAAHRSRWRHYEVWIYSDHGQCAPSSYAKLRGYPIEEAVSAAFAAIKPERPAVSRPKQPVSVQTQRVRLLGGKRFQHLFSVFGWKNGAAPAGIPEVAALGPVGFVYSPWQLQPSDYAVLARELVQHHQVPVVIARSQGKRLRAWTADGEFHLPEQTARVFGADHPFLDDIARDLLRLCAHADAGELVLLGWHQGVNPLTFAIENGSHAGLTPEETAAFCLLPHDAWLPQRNTPYLRPAHLREAAQHFLGRTPQQPARLPERSSAPTRTLRLMTYNVHSCVGMDGRVLAKRIARVIARANPDVVALQELDAGRPRTGGEDQAHLIARYLEMDYHFHAAIHLEEEQYGDAILTHLPLKLIKSAALPGQGEDRKREPRGAIWVAVDLHGTQVHIINTHLGLSPRERLQQVDALLGRDWLGHPLCNQPVILCGDFNAIPSSRVCRQLRTRLQDAQEQLKEHKPRNTFFSRMPTARIDYIFVDPAIEVKSIEVPRSQLTRVASDHLPLIADLCIPTPAEVVEDAAPVETIRIP